MALRENPRLISVVVPCFNEEEVLEECHRRLSSVLSSVNIPAEIIFIDDGSRDRTAEVIRNLREGDARVKLVKLSRNFGHQIALTAGLDRAQGDAVLIIDADLQDPPELLEKMLEKWREGYAVVYGKRLAREGETILKRLFAYTFYRYMSKVTGVEIPTDAGDFRLLDDRALAALCQLRERHRFVRGMVSWVGYPQTPMMYQREKRFAGNTKYPFRKSLKLAIDAITSFSYAPLRIATWLGLSISIFAFLYIIFVIYLKILGINFYGYTSIMASVLLLGGVQLMVLGVIGEYVGRVFEQGQNRPLYFVDEVLE